VKKWDYEGFPGTKLYFTEADSSSQVAYGIGRTELELKLKLWLLLAEHVILSTGHMIKSDHTYAWLSRNAAEVEQLAESHAIIPSLSDRYENCYEYAHDQVGKLSYVEAIEELPRDPKVRARFLDDIFPIGITWSSAGESHDFREMMLRDLNDSSSPLRRRMRFVRKDEITNLSSSIRNTENFTRGTLISVVRKHCPKRERLITRYGDCFYYLSGALHKEAFPLMHMEAARLCKEKVSHAMKGGIHDDEASVWEETMDSWGLTRKILDRLSLAEILDIRKDPLGLKVRETWGSLVNAARDGIDFNSHLSTIEDFRKHLVELFREEVNIQNKRHRGWLKGRAFVEIGAWGTTGIGLIGPFALPTGPVAPAISFAAGVLGLLAGRPILDGLEKRFSSTELVLLADRIRERQ